jgi:hypothetical protein
VRCAGFVALSCRACIPLLPGGAGVAACAAQQREVAAEQSQVPVDPSPTRQLRAQSTRSGNGKRIALVIGNAKYAMEPLRNPLNDADSIAKALADLDFEVDKLENADLARMKRATIDFGQKLAASGGVGLFYFSGHGLQVNGVNYLVPVDAKLMEEAYVDVETFSAKHVLDAMDAAGNSANLVILDACRNNPFVRSSTRSIARGLAYMGPHGGTLIAYATSPGAVAADGTGENGLYTQSLLQHIEDPGITVQEVFFRTAQEVNKTSGGNQTSWYESSLLIPIVLKGQLDPAKALASAKEALEQKHFADAARGLVAALNTGEWPEGPTIDEAMKLLSQAKSAIGEFDLKVQPPTAMVRLNGEPAKVVNGKLLLDPGQYTLSAEKTGYVPATRTLDVVAGHEDSLELKLPEPPPQTAPDWKPWALVAGGGALIAAGTVTGIMSLSSHQTLDQKCPYMHCSTDPSFDWNAEKSRGQTLAVFTDILIGAGLVSAAAGMGFLYFGKPSSIERPVGPTVQSSFACDRSGCLGGLRGRF